MARRHRRFSPSVGLELIRETRREIVQSVRWNSNRLQAIDWQLACCFNGKRDIVSVVAQRNCTRLLRTILMGRKNPSISRWTQSGLSRVSLLGGLSPISISLSLSRTPTSTGTHLCLLSSCLSLTSLGLRSCATVKGGREKEVLHTSQVLQNRVSRPK